jgi:hypothetical protein
MISFLLCESSKADPQGWFHEVFLHDGITFATWGLVIVTLALVVDSWLKGKEQRRRWKRDDRVSLLQRIDLQFNSPAMLSARRKAGSVMLDQGHNVIANAQGYVPPAAWPVINFFLHIAIFWKEGHLELKDIDVVYRDHIFRIRADFGTLLDNVNLQGRYALLHELWDALSPANQNELLRLEYAVPTVRTEFWRRESEL